MRFARHALVFCVLFPILGALPATAAHPERAPRRPADERVRLFLDCVRTYCDFDFLRREITFVDWIRVRDEADVHVLVTSQRTGSDGRAYTLGFIGLDRFSGSNRELTYTVPQTATPDDVRKGFARVLALGLVPYVITTPTGERLRVVDEQPNAPTEAAQVIDDPWDNWIFRTRVASRLDGERRVSSSAVSGAVAANRVTDAWKVNVSLDGRYAQSRFEFDDGTEPYTSVSRNWGLYGLVVKSLTQKWSAGVRTSASSSTYLNQRFVNRVAPALEFNIFPYAESTRRRWTVQYATGVRHAEYYEPTVYDLSEETRWDHSLTTELDLKQPWGTWNTAVDFQQYFYDGSKYRVGFDNEFDIRLFKGLSLNLDSNAQIIRNQIYLPAGEATPEEILVRQRQLATSFSYYVSFGIGYTFGSVFNNVVNRRFGG